MIEENHIFFRREVTCDAQSYCIVDESTGTAKCQCSPGFEEYSLSVSAGRTGCRDVDECARGTHDCSPFADCVNQEASFACRCRPGYVGDGRECLGL
jgi:nidogen (entactin)